MNDWLDHTRRAMHYSFAGWVLMLFMVLRLPGPDDIESVLFNQPVQKKIPQNEFHFPYQGQDIRVWPVMSYEISGLVMSHNDPAKWYSFDITHDTQSINTRDVCLIWGSNLRTDDYKKVRFSNDDYMCNWSYGRDVKHINEKEISNNHLITASDKVREQIADLRIGDQVSIVGKLVSFGEQRWGNRMNGSSLTRDDTGRGACENIYVESVTVLRSHNWLWALLGDIFFWIFVLTFSVRVTVFLMPEDRLHLPRWVQKIVDLYKPFN